MRQSEFVIAVADCHKRHIQKTEIQLFLNIKLLNTNSNFHLIKLNVNLYRNLFI